MEKFSCQYRAYLEDTDAGGIVYHANHIRFFDRARTEWLRARDLVEMRKQFNYHFVIRHIDIKYHRPIKIDDLMTVTAGVHSINGTYFVASQELIVNGKAMASAKFDITLIDGNTMRPIHIPEDLLTELLKDQAVHNPAGIGLNSIKAKAVPVADAVAV
ncbi:YbgC/FadM family acyl-CoA thioesterase [Acinetobacter indicus]|uniref:YbgC/FadM family acyl-CoA thioesterase n=1 Tax=Acinetobacter TaxID=469 RepID=UPI0015D364E5|nr:MULTISPECIES: YbgC/FadM family acyl-CoA thioesterase [Acinetobacter]MCP0918030.1 YbgC/FadM family acyl-CoA thioesterase [Acinetobacter indicus]